MEPSDYPIEEQRFGPSKAVEWHVSGNHRDGAYALFADGSVRFLRKKELSSQTVKSLATIDGGERIAQIRLELPLGHAISSSMEYDAPRQARVLID
jgi:prepilin-type processing-associated H-X9-DG protein